ncbi:MAG: Asp-tRNA(Asn)/Glu-tRNA(Gln) amidotransferase GatCAB subunit A, partial [Clostridia bacterium]|nr:Asp-tRNA(Asn)/Glu-tRNA(Gln) amidotransferase GatCAB subunit A [Clostridia bacterium]
MKLYNAKAAAEVGTPVLLDDMIMTTDMPTTAGSRMLAGYKSLFEATAVTLLREAGYGVAAKASVGEFGFDLIGETAAGGATVSEGGALTLPIAEAVATEGYTALALDTNGTPRRGAAQRGLCFLKPTYGVVSRFGTVPVACSGEAVGVMAKTAAECKK